MCNPVAYGRRPIRFVVAGALPSNRATLVEDPMPARRPERPDRDAVLKSRLQQAGLRVTRARLAVLRELDRSRQPVSHADINDRLGGGELDRVTIYRNLMALAQAGLVLRTDLGDHVWRFELARAGAPSTTHGTHPHFVCIDCGDVECLPKGAVAVKPVVASGSVLEVQVRGRCAACI